MAGLDHAASALRGLLGAAGFIRRDRARRALFVSDYPRRLDGAGITELERALALRGWRAAHEGGLALLDLDFSGYAAFFEGLATQREDRLPLGYAGLLRVYARHQTTFTPAMLETARAAVLAWDAGEHGALLDLAGAQLALALRRKEPPPGFIPRLLAAACDNRKESPAC